LRVLAVAVLGLALSAPVAADARLRLKPVGTFDQPVYVTSPPGDAATLVVAQRYGRVKVVRHGHVRRRPLLDLRVRIGSPRPEVDQRGLFSIAFAPDYAASGRLYVDYVDRHGELRVDEWRRRTGRLRHVLDLGPATNQHHGGQLQFGPDGLLYVWIRACVRRSRRSWRSAC
jgi:glucose/arabinose dehydrogenase